MERTKLENEVGRILMQCGISTCNLGYGYLKTAIVEVILDPILQNYITKELYPIVAGKHNTTPLRCERAMRHAIGKAYLKGNIDLINTIVVSSGAGKATNSEFISSFAEYMRMRGDGE